MSETRKVQEERWRGWMVAAQAGDGASYERLLRELLPRVRGFVRSRVFDPSVREDVVQNVLLSLHRARHTYRAERPFAPWLYAIARNAITDHARARARRRGRELPLDDAAPADVATPAWSPADGELAPELSEALAALPPKQREAVELVQLEGLSVAEAAVRAGVSPGALKVRAHRGYKALRARLGAEEVKA